MDTPNCSLTSVHSFPTFSLPGGPVVLTIFSLLVVAYLFLMLARICDHYFVSCIKIISYNLGISSDVAGATLMAVAVSCPDLFMNCVATFVTEGDIGLGTVVGVTLFNILAVPALSVLLQPHKEIVIDYWSTTRDALFFGLSLICLSLSLLDNKIEWYEGLMFISLYAVYISVLCCNRYLRSKIESHLDKFRISKNISVEKWPLIPKSQSVMSYNIEEDLTSLHMKQNNECSFQCEGCLNWMICLLYTPIDLLLYITIPYPQTRNGPSKWYPLTFIACLTWVALISYTIAWMITVAGYELQIPDSLLGLTFIAIGMSIPEATASVIVARQGHGSMALSNSLGANTFDILICLGLPWVFKATYFSDPFHHVHINSRGIGYSALLLAAALILLYFCLAINRYKLSKTIGAVLLTIYLVFATLTALMEMNVFFIGNLPLCQ
ncbi:hypothetical protein O3M35_001502 [Rhynocoris fuscipes]|uniref:Sodium/calcium exchanger membrane region domain-containing protein n=1 Tax=Rhynocoris fuscipes TaxID=488301 RepID=A0AAW1CR48_9HEMI